MRKEKGHFLHEFEWFVDKAIPYLLVILAVLLVLEFIIELEHYEPWVTAADYVIVGFFVTDLYFKWNHVQNVKMFVRLYWIDIIAVFPFYLLFRLYGLVTGILIGAEELGIGQKFAHEAVLVREAELLKEAKLAREIRLLREARLFRALRFFQRLLRAIKARMHIVRREMHKRSKQLDRK